MAYSIWEALKNFPVYIFLVFFCFDVALILVRSFIIAEMDKFPPQSFRPDLHQYSLWKVSSVWLFFVYMKPCELCRWSSLRPRSNPCRRPPGPVYHVLKSPWPAVGNRPSQIEKSLKAKQDTKTLLPLEHFSAFLCRLVDRNRSIHRRLLKTHNTTREAKNHWLEVLVDLKTIHLDASRRVTTKFLTLFNGVVVKLDRVGIHQPLA